MTIRLTIKNEGSKNTRAILVIEHSFGGSPDGTKIHVPGPRTTIEAGGEKEFYIWKGRVLQVIESET